MAMESEELRGLHNTKGKFNLPSVLQNGKKVNRIYLLGNGFLAMLGMT